MDKSVYDKILETAKINIEKVGKDLQNNNISIQDDATAVTPDQHPLNQENAVVNEETIENAIENLKTMLANYTRTNQ